MRARAVLAVYILAFGAAACFHALDLIRWGLFPYRFAPWPMNVFWTSLTLLDPLAIALLVTGRRRTGLVLASAIMIADVAVNSFAHFGLGYSDFTISLLLQTAFLGFVLGSLPFLWRQRTANAGGA